MFFTAKDDEQANIVIRNIMRMAGELKMATYQRGRRDARAGGISGDDEMRHHPRCVRRPMRSEFTELLARKVNAAIGKGGLSKTGRPLAVFVPPCQWG